jgi:2,3-bisphosphoglycerate-independent phosphoglycerate mutase
MKYIILIGDGMSDNPIERLDGKTPLQFASTPNMDRIAGAGRYGLFASVPDGFPPGSDVAGLSIFGYASAKYYTGRAPLEAASIGVKLGPKDMAFRCNLVNLVDNGGSLVMDDYSAGHISIAEATELVKALDAEFSGTGTGTGVKFYPGTSYRHLMVWENAPEEMKDLVMTPPHDISDKATEGHLPKGPGADELIDLMARSRDILSKHPVNKSRVSDGNKPASSIWLWGNGFAPRMPTMKKRFGVEGALISAVDLMKGIGVYAGLEILDVPGATGYLDTNYAGKVEYALRALKDKDFVCLHVEAPDEAAHQGNLEDKIRGIEDFDSEVVAGILEGIEDMEFTLLVLNDHPTPVELKTHTSDPVPFAICTSAELKGGKGSVKFSEEGAEATGLLVKDCEEFAAGFFGK